MDLTGGKLKVSYADGTFDEVAMTSDMVTGFNPKKGGEQTLTVTYGSFAGTFTVTIRSMYGDLNNDQTVETQDLALLKKLLAGLISKDEVAPGADCNGDGEIDTNDLAILKKFLAGIEGAELGPKG